MERDIFDAMRATEDRHWWFVARRNLCASLLKRLKIPSDANIMEAGCGSGGNLRLLQDFGNVYAFEMDDTARQDAINRGIGTVEAGRLPDDVPFGDRQFDIIFLADVLEHIKDDAAALRALHSRLKPDGILLITVPAFQFLFSKHDVANHHHRRYGKPELLARLQEAGFKVETLSYWNTLLFLPAALMRLLEKGNKTGKNTAGSATPPGIINKILIDLVSLERFFLRFPGLPFGISLIAVARK